MITSFPDLPFTDYGNALLNPAFHSAAQSTPRAYPRTDLEILKHWDSFPLDIHNAIQSKCAHLSPAHFSIPLTPKERFVANEEALRSHAMVELHEPVAEVLKMLGVEGEFALPGSGNLAIVGEPDLSWVKGSKQPHSKIIVEYKTWWAVDLMAFSKLTPQTTHDIQSLGHHDNLEAFQQTYGYMTFNENRFGILTNWRRALFLRRAESSGHKTLEYYLLELGGPISMLKAWVGIILLAENNWFYASPTPNSAPPSRTFGASTTALKERKYHIRPVDGKYPCIALDFCLCFFDLNSSRSGEKGCVVNGRLLQSSVEESDLHVIYKVVDIFRHHDAADMLEREACVYAALQNLQGQVIPMLYGFYNVWGILRLLALEPVGKAIPEDEEIDQTLRMKMKATLEGIHNAGFVHGDVVRRNFCRTEGGKIFLVDLETCRRAENPSELGDEMNKVDRL